MIGWAAKPKKKFVPRNRKQILGEIADEKRRVIKSTGGKAGHDALNLYYADYFLSRRGTDEYPEGCIQIQYALNVCERMGISIEENVNEILMLGRGK